MATSFREAFSTTTETWFPFLQKLLEHLPAWTDKVVQLCKHITPAQAGIGAFLGYLVLVRVLRWRRYNAIHQKYSKKWDNGRGRISAEEAQQIMHTSVLYDMPLLLNYALAFALFKTYAIPTISKLLLATKELGTATNVAKRYADTEILIATWVGCPITGFLDPQVVKKNLETGDPKPAEDPRAMLALARVNWLHSRYRISNDDYLYTLSLFVLEPGRWAAKFGWRALSPLENHAFYVFWAEIGKKMGITDIPPSLDELDAWSRAYEAQCMVPADTNRLVAEHTTNELIAAVPGPLKQFARNTTVCLLDETTRVAMLQEAQPAIHRGIVKLLLLSTGFFQRWFLLPRTDANFWFPIDVRAPKIGPDGKCPRMHPNKFTSRPWYKPERRGIGRIFDKFLVSVGWYADVPGDHLRSSGYRIEEMGPLKYETVGQQEAFEQAAKLQGCPIGPAWTNKTAP